MVSLFNAFRDVSVPGQHLTLYHILPCALYFTFLCKHLCCMRQCERKADAKVVFPQMAALTKGCKSRTASVLRFISIFKAVPGSTCCTTDICHMRFLRRELVQDIITSDEPLVKEGGLERAGAGEQREVVQCTTSAPLQAGSPICMYCNSALAILLSLMTSCQVPLAGRHTRSVPQRPGCG